jgi:hypothetical protein
MIRFWVHLGASHGRWEAKASRITSCTGRSLKSKASGLPCEGGIHTSAHQRAAKIAESSPNTQADGGHGYIVNRRARSVEKCQTFLPHSTAHRQRGLTANSSPKEQGAEHLKEFARTSTEITPLLWSRESRNGTCRNHRRASHGR